MPYRYFIGHGSVKVFASFLQGNKGKSKDMK